MILLNIIIIISFFFLLETTIKNKAGWDHFTEE